MAAAYTAADLARSAAAVLDLCERQKIGVTEALGQKEVDPESRLWEQLAVICATIEGVALGVGL